jgi:hypothetical protein
MAQKWQSLEMLLVYLIYTKYLFTFCTALGSEIKDSAWQILIKLMFCSPCIIAYQYNETNVTHFLFSLLIIKDLYMFRALLAHPQEVLHKRHLVYCVRIMSVGCGAVAVSLQPCHYYARNIPSAVCASTSWG